MFVNLPLCSLSLFVGGVRGVWAGGRHQLNDWSVKTGMDLMGISDSAALRLHYEAAAH